MGTEGISHEVKNLISEHIDSVVQLEILLLLHSTPQRTWSAEQIGRELRVDPAWVAADLATLAAHGLLAKAPEADAYLYGPSSPELHQSVTDLAEAYTDRRVSVTTLIFSKPVDKIRIFADAFRIRKDPSDG